MTLRTLCLIMKGLGVTSVFAKILRENDNSKNQIYLGADFSALNVLPVGRIEPAPDNPKILKARLDFAWLTEAGELYAAPAAQVILYPQYPEVRMSGFLMGCDHAPSALLSARTRGRVLFLGITPEGRIVGHAAPRYSSLARELRAKKGLGQSGVFLHIPLEGAGTDRSRLLRELLRIHQTGWIASQRMQSDGSITACRASNCGGYTLEAELGIRPNGYAAPDFDGWEVKQYAVADLAKPDRGGVITLMTPEPTAGYYRTRGLQQFVRAFGYSDRDQHDRLNFVGRHLSGVRCQSTGLTLRLIGYDEASGTISDTDGGIALVTPRGAYAAMWPYAGLISHWNKKHNQAVYVPCVTQRGNVLRYRFGGTVRLGQGTDFLHVLRAIAARQVYYDPGIKIEAASTSRPLIKRRSQFRVRFRDVSGLYDRMDAYDLVSSRRREVS